MEPEASAWPAPTRLVIVQTHQELVVGDLFPTNGDGVHLDHARYLELVSFPPSDWWPWLAIHGPGDLAAILSGEVSVEFGRIDRMIFCTPEASTAWKTASKRYDLSGMRVGVGPDDFARLASRSQKARPDPR